LLLLNPYDPNKGTGIDPATTSVRVGQEITVPNPDYPLPTETPIPENVAFGTKTDYTIQAGDTLAAIASKFNSTVEDIIKENNITDPNKISVGTLIVVRMNLVTPTLTPHPTITAGPSLTPPSPFTATPTP
jgi:LysM repeat protein